MPDQVPSFDDLYGPQSTTAAPVAAPVTQDQTPSYDQLYPSVSEVVVTGHRLAPPQNVPPETALGYAGTTASNIIPSAWNVIQGIGHVVAHPIQTTETLGQVAGGVAQHGMNVVSGGNAPQVFDTKTADALGQMYKDRYGGLSNIKHTFETDPVGVLADASAPLTLGGDVAVAGARALGDVGTVSNVLGGAGKVAQTAGALTNPVNAFTKPIGLAGKVVDKVAVPYLGTTTGAGSGAIRGAYAAGQAGGDAQKAFQGAISGATPPQAIVADAAQKANEVDNIIRTNPIMVGAKNPATGIKDATTIPLGDVKNQFLTDAVGNRSRPAGYTGPAVGVGPSQKAIDAVSGILTKYDDVAKPALRSPQGIHSMLDEVTQYRDSLPKTSPDYALADNTVSSVTDALAKKAPFYAKQVRTIQSVRNAAADANQALQTGNDVDNKMLALGKAAQPLASDFSGSLPAATSGNALKRLFPHANMASALTDIADIGIPLYLGHENALSSLMHGATGALASSPRVVGSGANLLGKISSSAPVQGALGTINLADTLGKNPFSRAAITQAGKTNYKSPDGSVTLDEYLKNNP